MRFTTASISALFWTLVCEVYYCVTFATFLDSSIYVVMLYEIVGGGWFAPEDRVVSSLRSSTTIIKMMSVSDDKQLKTGCESYLVCWLYACLTNYNRQTSQWVFRLKGTIQHHILVKDNPVLVSNFLDDRPENSSVFFRPSFRFSPWLITQCGVSRRFECV